MIAPRAGWVVASVLFVGLGCSGDIDLRGYEIPPPRGLSPSVIRRLSRLEYENTLNALVGANAVGAASTPLSALPDDRVKNEFSTKERGTTPLHVDGYYEVADAVTTYLTANATRLGQLHSGLSTSGTSDAVVQDFIRRFGKKAYRRPLTPAEESSLFSVYSDGKTITQVDGLKNLMVAVMMSPNFLYRIEEGTTAAPEFPNTYALTSYELASRLSYLAWAAPPDDALLNAAESGALATSEGFDAELNRVFDDPRALATLEQFFMEWLDANYLPTLAQSDAFMAGISRSGLVQAMQDELRAFLRARLQDGSSYAELLSSNESYVNHPGLAALYGVTPGQGGKVTFTGERHRGLLGRAALLVSASEETHPVLRGVFVSRKLLCDPISPPDPTLLPPGAIAPPPFNPNKTARTRWTEQTATPICASCHSRMNAYGFGLENYDPIGRFRAQEPILDPTTKTQVNLLSIDAAVDLAIHWATGGDSVRAEGSGGIGDQLGASDVGQHCFAQQWFRFVTGRNETLDDEGVLWDVMKASTGDSNGLKETFKALARAPEFKLRRIEE